jgi:fucose permease
VINNFAPLVFLTFQTTYDISLYKITLLATVNFGVQLLVDLLSVKFVDRIGYKPCIIAAHALCCVGLVFLTVLPGVFGDPFWGLFAAVVIYASGGGLLEVLLSPIMEASPTENKEKAMSLLHSFYCWGSVCVVLVSTLFFVAFGVERWRILVLAWAALPIINGIVFLFSPVKSLECVEENGCLKLKELLKNKLFWVFMILILCAGACEQSVSQWASAFAERSLGVSKTVGDLAGPMLFAAMMGASRLLYGRFGERIRLESFMTVGAAVCVVSYLLISLTGSAAAALIGCGACGFSVGIMWPGIFSTAAKSVKGGGTAMFALFALAGDMGCAAGPAFVGIVSGAAGGRLEVGILAAAVFPMLALLFLLAHRKKIFKL